MYHKHPGYEDVGCVHVAYRLAKWWALFNRSERSGFVKGGQIFDEIGDHQLSGVNNFGYYFPQSDPASTLSIFGILDGERRVLVCEAI
jgi:hypothetical protein